MSGRRRGYCPVAIAGLGLACAAAGLGVLSGMLYRFEWLALGDAFTLLRWAAYGGVAALLVCVAGLVRARPGGSRRGFPAVVAGLVLAGVVVWIPFSHQDRAREVPPIHDITTDTRDPPEFRAVLPLRPADANSLEYGGEPLARQQQQAYPDIAPLILDAPPAPVFDAALETAREQGWEIVEAARGAGRLEAVDTTFWFGFRDDIVVRIRDDGADGTRVDMRSVSRVGRSDIGTNADRVRRYLDALAARL